MTGTDHERWLRVKERLRTEVGEEIFQSWFARMDLERRRPALYGQRQQVQLELGPALSARLERAEQRVNCNDTATELPAMPISDAQVLEFIPSADAGPTD